jgi:hypothetical protein
MGFLTPNLNIIFMPFLVDPHIFPIPRQKKELKTKVNSEEVHAIVGLI